MKWRNAADAALIFVGGLLLGVNLAAWRFACTFGETIIRHDMTEIALGCAIASLSTAFIILRSK